MVVDDNADVVHLMKKFLERRGHEVVGASSGGECLNKLIEVGPDLVVLDIMMPGMSGWEACKRIKEDPSTSSISVAMFSIRSSQEDMVRSLRDCRADAHFSKELGFDNLANSLEELLKRTTKQRNE